LKTVAATLTKGMAARNRRSPTLSGLLRTGLPNLSQRKGKAMIMHPDIGVLNGGKCYVFLEGFGLHREPMYGTYEECLNAIDARGGVDDPIPTDGIHKMTDYKAALEASKPKVAEIGVPATAPKAPATKRRRLRDYTVSIKVAEKIYAGTCVIDSYEITASAYDREDAIRQGRESWRENVGAYGPKATFRAHLTD
jgi:hypothetical protein